MVNREYLYSESTEAKGNLNSVNWDKSQAYAIVLNSIYLNMSGREGEGIIPLENKDGLVQKIKNELVGWKGPDGRQVVRRALSREDVFQGPYTEYGPDIIVGYNQGYRASALTGLGDWDGEEVEPNQDHWGSDHCFDAESVPGVLFSSRGLRDISSPSFADIPMLTIDKELKPSQEVEAPQYSDEDQEKIEERLKELGYL
jgi:hypothetical protein